MVSNIVHLPKRPTGQLRGKFQGKTGPAAMILQFLQLQHLADHYKFRHIGTKWGLATTKSRPEGRGIHSLLTLFE
jgi:hypothetical protein